jgi:hypothetical protein
VSRLLHFPVPVAVLVAASLAGNLLQPTVLASLPVAAAVAFALSRTPATLPFTFAGSLLSLLFLLSATQVSGLLLHGISRRRRFQDVAIFLVVGLGFVISIVPMILISGSAGPALGLLRGLAGHDVAVLSPFAWGIRAAVHAGDGDARSGWRRPGRAIAGAGLSAASSSGSTARAGMGGPPARAKPRGRDGPRAIGAQLEKDPRTRGATRRPRPRCS